MFEPGADRLPSQQFWFAKRQGGKNYGLLSPAIREVFHNKCRLHVVLVVLLGSAAKQHHDGYGSLPK